MKPMIDATKLQYFTLASWLRGYAGGLDWDVHPALVHKMNQAADLLEKVWADYVEQEKIDE